MSRINQREAGGTSHDNEMQTALPTLALMNRLKSLRLGDYKCFYSVCCDLLTSMNLNLQANTSLFLAVWFFLECFSFFFFAHREMTWRLSLFLHFSLRLQLLKAGIFSVFFQSKRNQYLHFPDTLKLQIACYLFLLLFLESRENFKRTPR